MQDVRRRTRYYLPVVREVGRLALSHKANINRQSTDLMSTSVKVHNVINFLLAVIHQHHVEAWVQVTKFHDFKWLQIIYVDVVKNVSVHVLVLREPEMLIVTHCFPHSLVENLTLNSPTSLFTLSSIFSIIKALKVLAPVVQTLKSAIPWRNHYPANSNY